MCISGMLERWLLTHIAAYYRNMLFGYDQGVMGSLLTGPSFEATFPSISNGNNATLQGFTVTRMAPSSRLHWLVMALD
jgi:hypothetical protein